MSNTEKATEHVNSSVELKPAPEGAEPETSDAVGERGAPDAAAEPAKVAEKRASNQPDSKKKKRRRQYDDLPKEPKSEDEEEEEEEEEGDEDNLGEDEEEDDLLEIDQSNIITSGRRTRGKVIDFAEAAAKLKAEEGVVEEEEDGEFEEK
ncbi:Histone H2A.Z-specific chaperone CHZ1 [[Candida] zeylanoides]